MERSIDGPFGKIPDGMSIEQVKVEMRDYALREKISDFLAEHTVMTLAVVDHNGSPHAASLMYAAAEDLSVCWVSDPTTRHSQYLRARSVCAITIAGQFDDFQTIHGLQMHGEAVRLDQDTGRREILNSLADRFVFFQEFQTATGPLAEQLSKADTNRFVPHTIAVIDNRLGLGNKQILDLTDE